jgi:hypothetical protein
VLSGRHQEGTGVLRQALVLAEEHHLPVVAMRARINLSQISIERDRFEEALKEVSDGLALARERGDRHWERQFQGQLMPLLHVLGRWDEALRAGSPLIAGEPDLDALAAAVCLSTVSAARGDEATLARCIELASQRLDTTYVDQRASARCVLARDALERAAPEETLSLLANVVRSENVASEVREHAFALSIEAATTIGDDQTISGLEAAAGALPQALLSPLIIAGRERLQAALAERGGDRPTALEHQATAIGLLRSVRARPLLAQALAEHSRITGDHNALGEAREIWTELGATRWLGRLEQGSEVPA